MIAPFNPRQATVPAIIGTTAAGIGGGVLMILLGHWLRIVDDAQVTP